MAQNYNSLIIFLNQIICLDLSEESNGHDFSK